MRLKIQWQGRRVIKARRALLDCPDILGPGSTFERKKKLLSRLQKWKGLNDRQVLVSFFEYLNSLDLTIGALWANRSASVLLSLQVCAIGIISLQLCYQLQISNSVLGATNPLSQYPTLQGRLQKLGAYYGAMLRVRALMGKPVFYDIRKQVYFHEVSISSLLLA